MALLSGCGEDSGRARRGETAPSVFAPCEVDASVEKTADDDAKVGVAARALAEKGPCVVAAARRWLSAHPAAYGGSPGARVVVRAVATVVGSVPPDVREEAIDLLLEAEASGDASVRRDAVAGLATAPGAMTARILRALGSGETADRERALGLVEVLGLVDPALVPAYARILDDPRAARDPAARAALVKALDRVKDPVVVGLDAIGRDGEHEASIEAVLDALYARDERGLLAELRRRWSGLSTPIRSAYVVAIRRRGEPDAETVGFLRFVVGTESSEAVRSDAAASLPAD